MPEMVAAKIIDNPQIGRTKRKYVSIIVSLSTLGLLVALYQLAMGMVGVMELVLFFSLYLIAGLGITVGFHRLLSHRSFDAPNWLKCAFAIMGSLAGKGPVISWVSTHRCHHRYSDKDGDPHSPHFFQNKKMGFFKGFWHAHLGWLFNNHLPNSMAYARDLIQNPSISWVNRHYVLIVSLGLLIPGLIGWAWVGNVEGMLQGLLWGGFARLFFTFHGGNTINSFTHLFGRREFKSGDYSRNNLLLAIPTLGEGWHNTHHAFPSSARFGLRWWQIDIGYAVIRVLSLLGLISAVRLPSAQAVEAKRFRSEVDAGSTTPKAAPRPIEDAARESVKCN